MGIIKRQGIQNTVISYAGVIIGYINTVLLLPRILDEELVGLTRLLLTIAVLYAQFSALGFANAGVKFFPYFRDKANQHNNFLVFFLGIPLVGFLAISLLFFLFRDVIINYYIKESPLIINYYYYIIPLGFFTLLFNLFNAYLTSLYKTVVPSFIQDFFLRISITLTILGYSWGLYNFEVFLLLFVVANCSTALCLLVYITWLKQLFIRPELTALKEKPLKSMVRYGLFALLGNISSTIIISIDTMMIGHYLGLGEVGIYTTAAYIASVILIPGRSLYKIALPQIADFWKTENTVALAKLYKQVTRMNLVIGCLLFIGIWANIENMFALLPPQYSQGRYVILFLGLARLFDLATGINGHILITSYRYRSDLILNILLSVLTIFSNLLFIPAYGIEGAALATMLSYVLINLLRLILVWFWFRMQPFDKTSLQIISLAAVSYLAGVALPYLFNTPVDIAIRSALITLIYGAGILFLNLAPELTKKLQSMLLNNK
ncbi:hypothetical protein AAE02nite_23100 [Adhaeribacter aerolatus]|uniref:Uncharacterized protein n=1 Tax=Adhaeribacter aerolatus TaxID=670289 RepID=A0A512AY52_9BACT|nr:oligosaccharide flippase family protein [Adhaeribacter aerolatus]GEO04646.1 hypothetical protein AAE02nite_23100 [Adhaeribacter aerolatus]